MANGGDNIAVYTALFASRGVSDILTIGIVFAVMTGLWCVAAHWFVNHKALRGPIQRQAHRIVPFVLVGLGVLSSSEPVRFRSRNEANGRQFKINAGKCELV